MTESNLEQLVEINLSPTRSIVVATASNGYLWLNEKIDSPDFKGFTHKGFGLKIEDIANFIDAVRDVASSSEDKEYRFSCGRKKELVVHRPDTNQVDIRHFITSEKYTGFLKKGIRVVSSNAIKITDGLAILLEQPLADPTDKNNLGKDNERWAQYDDCCKSCGTTRRQHFREGLCAICYEREHRIEGESTIDLDISAPTVISASSKHEELLEVAYGLHGKRCYVCNNTPTKVGPLVLYFADTDTSNTSESNMYPVCVKCKSLI